MRSKGRLRTLGSISIGVVAALASCLAAKADEPQPAASRLSFYGDPGVPDISGLWLGSAMGIPGHGAVSNSGKTPDGRPPTYWAPWPLPYTPVYQKILEDRAAATKKGVAIGDIGSRCLPFGLPAMLVSKFYPDEIIQTPGAVTIFVFATFPIVIWTDGRPHPQDLTSSYNGHSIGYWVGDTLFVDTVGINGTTPIDAARDPHSANLHMKWSIQRVAPDLLHIHLTLLDNDAFVEPVTITNIWQRKSGIKWEVLDDQSCFENNQSVAPPPVASGFTKF